MFVADAIISLFLCIDRTDESEIHSPICRASILEIYMAYHSGIKYCSKFCAGKNVMMILLSLTVITYRSFSSPDHANSGRFLEYIEQLRV